MRSLFLVVLVLALAVGGWLLSNQVGRGDARAAATRAAQANGELGRGLSEDPTGLPEMPANDTSEDMDLGREEQGTDLNLPTNLEDYSNEELIQSFRHAQTQLRLQREKLADKRFVEGRYRIVRADQKSSATPSQRNAEGVDIAVVWRRKQAADGSWLLHVTELPFVEYPEYYRAASEANRLRLALQDKAKAPR